MVADPLRAVVAVEVVAGVEGAVEVVAGVEGAAEVVVAVAAAEDLPQPLAPPRTAMEDQMGASKAIPPLSLMEIDPRANNS